MQSIVIFLPGKVKANMMTTAPTGSVTSLVAGLLFGLAAAVGAYLASQNPRNVWLSLGTFASLYDYRYYYVTAAFIYLSRFSVHAGTAGTLAVVMGLRFLSSWMFMPAGLMTVAR